MRDPRVLLGAASLAAVLVTSCDSSTPSGGAPTASAPPANKDDCAKVTRAFELQGARMATLGRTADIGGSVDVYRQYAEELDLLAVREGDLKALLDSHKQHVKRAVEGGRKAADPATRSQGMTEFMAEAGRAGDDKRRIDELCAKAR